jgi:type IV pilus assembly protein PilB
MAVKLGEMLVKAGLISAEQLEEALESQKSNGEKLGFNLIKLGYVREDDITQLLSEQFGVPSINLRHFEIDDSVINLIPSEVAQKYLILPVNRTGATLTISMADPTNVFAMDDIKFMTGYNVEPVVASEIAIREAIEKYYGSQHALELKKVMDEMAEAEAEALEVLEDDEELDLATLEAATEEAPVVKLVNIILTDSIKKSASDIHIEPYEKDFRVRFRIDGVLYEIMHPPMKLRDAITSRLKIMAKLDIPEKRLPQDGRIKIKMKLGGKTKEMDYRVSCLPTLFGEKIVLRLLDKDNLMLDMTKLGFESESLQKFERTILKPYGMVLVTGPTGSGKTNTLYSSMNRVNTPETNIMTAEDPVEFNLHGINQVQMKEQIGLNFAAALRSFLRQDRGQGGPHRPPGVVDLAHQRRAVHDQPSDEHGHRAIPGRDVGQPDLRPATGSPHLQGVCRGDQHADPGPGGRRPLTRGSLADPAEERPRVYELQQHRLPRPCRTVRGHGDLGGDSRVDSLRGVGDGVAA